MSRRYTSLLIILILLFNVGILFSEGFEKKKIELVVQSGHTDKIYSKIISSDGHLLLTSSNDGSAKVWDMSTGNLLRTFEHNNGLNNAIFSPNGKEVITSCRDGYLRIWDLYTGYTFDSVQIKSGKVLISSDNQYLIVESYSVTEVFEYKSLMKLYSDSDYDFTFRHYISNEKRILLIFTDTSEGIIKIVRIENGKVKSNTLETYSNITFFSKLSVCGNYLATSHKDSIIKVWDINKLKKIFEFPSSVKNDPVLEFSQIRNYLIHSDDKKILKLRDIKTGKVLNSFDIKNIEISEVKFSSDDKFLYFKTKKNNFLVMDLLSSKTINIKNSRQINESDLNQFRFYIQDKEIEKIDFPIEKKGQIGFISSSPNKKYFAFTNEHDGSYQLWDLKQLTKIAFINIHDERIHNLTFSNNNKFIASSSYDKTAKVIEIKSQEIVLEQSSHTDKVTSAIFSDDNEFLLTSSLDGKVKVTNLDSGKIVMDFLAHTKGIVAAKYSNKGKSIITCGKDGIAKIFDTNTGDSLMTFLHKRNIVLERQGPEMYFESWVVDSYFYNDSIFATIDMNNTIYWNILNNEVVKQFKTEKNYWNLSIMFALFYHIPCHYQLSIDLSNFKIKLINNNKLSFFGNSGSQILDMIPLDSGWVVKSPDGRFDISSKGRLRNILYITGLETIYLDQLNIKKFKKKNLFREILSGRDQQLSVQREKLDSIWLFPKCKIDSLSYDYNQKEYYFSTELENRGGGYGNVEIHVNGKPVIKNLVDTNLRKKKQFYVDGEKVRYRYVKKHSGNNDTTIRKLKIEFPIHEDFFFQGKENIISVRAWNSDSTFRSRDVDCKFTASGTIPDSMEVQFFLVSIGISKYNFDDNENENLLAVSKSKDNVFINLPFADKDAKDISKAFSIGARNVFKPDLIHNIVLTTSDSILPTRQNIIDTLKHISKIAKAHDVLVIYYSGHGTVYNDDFYYIPYGMKTGYLEDKDYRGSFAIKDEEMNELIRKIPCNKCALILDACGAGKITDDLNTYKKDISDSREKTIELIREGSGMVILAGSAANAYSFMGSGYNQSFLTYGLLEGLKGDGLTNDSEIRMRPLFDYASKRASELAIDNGLIQNPQTIGYNDIFVGKIYSNQVDSIPYESRKPIISGIKFQMAVEPYDDIEQVEEKLENSIKELLKSSDNKMLLVNNRIFPRSFRITGNYVIKDDFIELKYSISYVNDPNNEEIKSFTAKLFLNDINNELKKVSQLILTEIRKISNKINKVKK